MVQIGQGCLTVVGVLGIHISSSSSHKPTWFTWCYIKSSVRAEGGLSFKQRLWCRSCMKLHICGRSTSSSTSLTGGPPCGSDWNIASNIGWKETFMLPEGEWRLLTLVTFLFPLTPPWGWHLLFWVKCLHEYKARQGKCVCIAQFRHKETQSALQDHEDNTKGHKKLHIKNKTNKNTSRNKTLRNEKGK